MWKNSANYVILIEIFCLNIREDTEMKISYNGLWKILIDKNMQKKDMIDKVGISSTTIAKMGKGEKVSLDVLERICKYLDCNIGDIISFEKIDNYDTK
jgi:DNA-binding Xre family transcriptional regulator